jgi:hypothetical protein
LSARLGYCPDADLRGVQLEREFKDAPADAIRLRTHLLNGERDILEAEVRHVGFNIRTWEEKEAENDRTIKVRG